MKRPPEALRAFPPRSRSALRGGPGVGSASFMGHGYARKLNH
ncbi:hypothetical protein [uncultured Acidovorax sp.]|nr:hypothetical protein [uncultured Acidovorax sp.]